MGIVDYENAINFDDFEAEDEKSLGTIYITGGGYYRRPFKGSATDSKYGWQELAWRKSPNRTSGKFAFQNIDNIKVGLVARCELNYKYMNISDYMALRQILGREKYFWVRFFDIDDGEWVEREMYCSENQINQLFTNGRQLLGVRDYSIKLVGTNRDLQDDVNYTIIYNNNGGTGSIANETVARGGEATLSDGTGFNKTGFSLIGWSITPDGGINYRLGQETTMWKNLTLYAVWEEANA